MRTARNVQTLGAVHDRGSSVGGAGASIRLRASPGAGGPIPSVYGVLPRDDVADTVKKMGDRDNEL